jgi:hypothetical protein
MNVKTIFSSNTQNVYQKTLFIKDTPTGGGTNIIVPDENIYKVLADYSVIIQKLLFDFSLGNFQNVSKLLTLRYYQYLSVKLSQITFTDYPIYEQLRLSTKYSLQGLYKGIQQYNVLVNTQKNLITMTEKASILDDMTKLKNYISGLKKNVALFPDMNITVARATIKPEYAEYIRLYGYPSNGIFDMDRLGLILIAMDLANFI